MNLTLSYIILWRSWPIKSQVRKNNTLESKQLFHECIFSAQINITILSFAFIHSIRMQEDFESTRGLTAVIRTLNSPHWEEVRYAYHHTELNTVTLRNCLETKLIEKKKNTPQQKRRIWTEETAYGLTIILWWTTVCHIRLPEWIK